MLTWTDFMETKMNKICIIMRGLPGSGKSHETNALLLKHGGDKDHIFSSDRWFTPVSNKLENMGNVTADTMSVEQAIAFCQELVDLWYKSNYGEAKREGGSHFLAIKKMIDLGNYYEAIHAAYAMRNIFEKVEYHSNWDGGKVGVSHKINFQNFKAAIDMGISPVIVDNTNVSVSAVAPYAQYANEAGYDIKIQEATSPHWLAHRDLFKDQYSNRVKIAEFAKFLHTKNQHNVPLASIETMMRKWVHNMTVKQALDYDVKKT